MKYVYLMRAGDSHYKVGVAVSVKRRVEALQTANGNKIYVIAAKLYHDQYGLERRIHQQLKSMSANGGKEWFLLEPEDALLVAADLNNGPEIDVHVNVDLNRQLTEQTLRHKRLEKKLDMLLNLRQRLNKAAPVPARTGQVEEPPKPPEHWHAQAMAVFEAEGKASTSLLQRKLGIGYGRAASIMDALEAAGKITSGHANKPRSIVKQPVR